MKRWLLPAALSLALTLAVLAIVELVARRSVQVELKHPSDSLIGMFIADEDTFWGLRPNFSSEGAWIDPRWGTEPIRINSLGMRGPEVTIPKPEGVKRVVVLGGSHPMGMWVNAGETYAAELERLLNAREPGRWQVLNLAVAGYTSWQGVLQMRTKVPAFEPDIVVSDLGVNDTLARVPWGLSRSDEEVHPPPAFLARALDGLRTHSVAYRWALKELTDRANQGDPIRVGKDEHLAHTLQIQALATEMGAKTVFMNHFLANVTSPGVLNNRGPLCLFPEKELEPAVVDVCGIFKRRRDLGELFADPLHANATGHAMIAEALRDKLVELGWVP